MRREVNNSFNRKFYEVEYNEQLDLVDTLWYGYASPNDLRAAMEVGLDVLQQTNCAFKLNDNTSQSGPWEDAVEWLQVEWLPQALQAGLRYLAHVALKHSYGEASGEAMEMSAIGKKLTYKMFSSRAEALAWLKTCQAKHAAVGA